MYISTATSFEIDLLDILYEINIRAKVPIKEIYGVLQKTPIGGGRPSDQIPQIDFDSLVEYIEETHKKNLEFCYLFNAPCLGNQEFNQKWRLRMQQDISSVYDAGIDSVTVANPFIIEYISYNYPSIKINTSINAEISSVERANYYESLGINKINLDYLMGRNLKLIQLIKENTSCEISVLVNEPCLYQCGNKQYHQQIFGHASQSGCQVYSNYFDYPQLKCSIRRLENPIQALKACWYRPEDTKYLEEIGVDCIKLAGRMMPTSWIAESCRAYAYQKYIGNIYHLIEKQGMWSKEYTIVLKKGEVLEPFRFSINNADLEGFFGIFLNSFPCDKGCKNCGHCHKFINTIKYDEEKRQKHVATLRKLHRLYLSKDFVRDNIFGKFQDCCNVTPIKEGSKKNLISKMV